MIVKKIQKKIILLFLFGIFLLSSSPALADCSKYGSITNVVITPNDFVSGSIDEIVVTFNASRLKDGRYKLVVFNGAVQTSHDTSYQIKHANTTSMTFILKGEVGVSRSGVFERRILLFDDGVIHFDKCELGKYTIRKGATAENCAYIISQQNTSGVGRCYWTGCLLVDEPVRIEVSGLEYDGLPYSGKVNFVLGGPGIINDLDWINTISPGIAAGEFTPKNSGNYSVRMEKQGGGNFKNCPKIDFEIKNTCTPEECNANQTPIGPGAPSDPVTPFELCAQIEEGTPQRLECNKCAYGDPNGSGNGAAATGMWTAVGCIPTNATSIVQVFIKIGLSIAGGVALLMILVAGFMLTTSQGDPKRTNEAKELLTSAVIGLLFIIFSVTMLQFIGVRILQIPGFGRT